MERAALTEEKRKLQNKRQQIGGWNSSLSVTEIILGTLIDQHYGSRIGK